MYMKKLRVLLVCGSGASSGFMAANIRKAASARGMDVSVVARSESEIESYIDEIDVLMAGPHLAYIMDEVDELAEANPDLKVILMRKDYYATLDGEAALDHMLEEVGEA
ncbi:PTS sugar transporter subunit IIB [[Collinsella] massiliensis]|uniref:PTS sugar transporter subunit IIB n=1 Tax=[Collinsella] massiliensis TaxID=1232426 RepID=UPI001F14226B|nr:PTS sugar transporter subunit IIB [[Collinsella] massiliensis]